jgi:protein Hikeshi
VQAVTSTASPPDMSLFAVIVSGRPIITQGISPEPNKYAFQIPSQPPFSSLAVFLLPGASLPADTAAAIYVQVPPSSDFKLVGAIANEKQSAIIKIRNTTEGAGANGVVNTDAMDDGPASGTSTDGPMVQGDVVVGLSIEPALQVAQNLEAQKATQTSSNTALELARKVDVPQLGADQRVSTKELAQRVINDAYNYLASFEDGTGMVPLKRFQEWWKKFEGKVDHDPTFLERPSGNRV